MTQPLIDRLNVLIKQLGYLNQILNTNCENLPDSLTDTFIESINIELSGIKELINRLHREVNELMGRCYKLSLDAVFNKCHNESRLTLEKIKSENKSNLIIDENN